jgi:hypothetical protein
MRQKKFSEIGGHRMASAADVMIASRISRFGCSIGQARLTRSRNRHVLSLPRQWQLAAVIVTILRNL